MCGESLVSAFADYTMQSSAVQRLFDALLLLLLAAHSAVAGLQLQLMCCSA
jgi:hypothetical protein